MSGRSGATTEAERIPPPGSRRTRDDFPDSPFVDPRTAWKRALLGLLAYLVLLLCWPLVRAVYGPAFRSSAEFAVGVIDPLPGNVRAHFEPGARGALTLDMPHVDTTVRLQHQELGGGDATFGASTFFHGYHPSVFLLALFLLATPLPWRVRRGRLLLALLLLHTFFALRCALAVYYAYCKGSIDGRAVVELSEMGALLLRWLWHFVWVEPLTTYLVPLAIWALLVFALGSRDQGRAQRERG